LQYRVGIGYDVHRLFKKIGSSLKICGVEFFCDLGIEAHSDGDVALHALTDAILGAIAAGDIGLHFPPTDPKWLNADSTVFLKHAVDLVNNINGVISNIDIIVICEEPKIMQKCMEIRENLANIIKIKLDRINIKATTTEKLGFLGKGEGIAAQAVCSIMIPEVIS